MFKNILHRLTSENNIIQLNYIYSLFILAAMAFILTTAMYMQLVHSEYPCPITTSCLFWSLLWCYSQFAKWLFNAL